MANPTPKNGFAPVANEMLEAFALARTSPISYQILFAVIRQTWGWEDKEASAGRRKYWPSWSGSELAEIIGRDVSETRRAVKRMVAAGVLRIGPEGLGIQSDHDLWGGEKRGLPVPEDSQSLGTPSPLLEDSQSSLGGLPVPKKRTPSPLSTVCLKKERNLKKEREDAAPAKGTGSPTGPEPKQLTYPAWWHYRHRERQPDLAKNRAWLGDPDQEPAGAPDWPELTWPMRKALDHEWAQSLRDFRAAQTQEDQDHVCRMSDQDRAKGAILDQQREAAYQAEQAQAAKP